MPVHVRPELVCTVTEVSVEMEPKALEPMDVTEAGMDTEVRPVDWKACWPMDVTPLPMTIDVRLLVDPKVLAPMYVTESGMMSEVRPVPWKAPAQ